MKLTNEVVMDVPAAEVWAAILDFERLAPCMPGATLIGSEGSIYEGRVKIKVGPVVASYQGEATILDVDEDAKWIRVSATGRETSGQGTAEAVVVATVYAEGATSRVVIETDLAIAGRLAQFGRGLMADVSSRLLSEFADNLERSLRPDDSAEPASGEPAAEMDALRLLGPVVLKRAAPVLVMVVILFLLDRRRRCAPRLRPI